MTDPTDPWAEFNLRLAELRRDVTDLTKAIEVLARRVDGIRPQVWNCPHCGRRVSQNAESCGICGQPIDSPLPSY